MPKVALLCHFPSAWFERCQIRFDASRVQGEIESGAFSTLEGYLCAGLADEPSIELHIITFSKSVTSAQEVPFGAGGRLHVLPAPPLSGMLTGWQPRSYIARKLIQKLAPDVVHGIRNLEGYGAMAVQSGFPHVITPQEFLDQVPRPPHLRLSFAIGSRVESLTLKKTRNLIVTTDVVEQWVAPRSQARRFRIPNIVADTFYRTPKAPSGDDVLFVGRLAPEKGVLDLLQALKIAGERGKRIRAQIVGGGSSEVFFQECRDFVAQHFEPEQVTFLGWQSSEAIAQLHAKSSLFIMPSLAPYETMGIVLAEALAAGTPSIVYDFGPMPKMIRHGETGWVVPPGNVEAMAAAMMRLLDEKQTLEIMSSKARAAAEPFTTSAVVRAHLQAYQTIASQDR